MITSFKKGFSLVEMVIYIAILVMMLAIIIQVLLSIMGSNRIVRAVRNIETSAVTALSRMGREVRRAESIDLVSSTLGTHPGVLSLDGESDGVAYSVDFYLADGRLRLKENEVDVGALTQASSTVTNLVFSRFSATDTEGVKIQMTIESGTSTAYRIETFYSSILLR